MSIFSTSTNLTFLCIQEANAWIKTKFLGAKIIKLVEKRNSSKLFLKWSSQKHHSQKIKDHSTKLKLRRDSREELYTELNGLWESESLGLELVYLRFTQRLFRSKKHSRGAQAAHVGHSTFFIHCVLIYLFLYLTSFFWGGFQRQWLHLRRLPLLFLSITRVPLILPTHGTFILLLPQNYTAYNSLSIIDVLKAPLEPMQWTNNNPPPPFPEAVE